jgi:hypothetical protein
VGEKARTPAETAKQKLASPGYKGIMHKNDQVAWCEDWPDYDTVKRAVTKWISMSQKDELKLLEALYTQRQSLPTPFEFAVLMHDYVPLTVTFNFLRNYKFVT